MKEEGNFNKNIIVEDEIIGDMVGCVADNTKLKNIYKNRFEFTELNKGINKMVNFYTQKI